MNRIRYPGLAGSKRNEAPGASDSAKKAEQVSDIVGRVPGAGEALANGEGEQVKAAINEACDAAWRAAHPERAEVLGGHNEEPRQQRLADALVAIVTGQTNTTKRRPGATSHSRRDHVGNVT